MTIVPLTSPPDVRPTEGLLTSPPASLVPDLWTLPVIVRIGDAIVVATYPDPGPGSRFVVAPGSDLTATVSLPNDGLPGLAFGLGNVSPTGPASNNRSLLNLPSVPDRQGTLTYTLHLGALPPGSDVEISMTVQREGDPNMMGGVIAEITTS